MRNKKGIRILRYSGFAESIMLTVPLDKGINGSGTRLSPASVEKGKMEQAKERLCS